jgi:hypothetical protein
MRTRQGIDLKTAAAIEVTTPHGVLPSAETVIE